MLLACNGKKQGNEGSTKSSKDLITWDGTYEGVMPASDCPGIYTLLALSKEGEFAMFQKYLEHSGTYVTKGKFEWVPDGDTIVFSDNDRTRFLVSENMLSINDIAFIKISDENKLNDVYRCSSIKEDKGGKNYEVKIYSDEKTSYAEFEFNDKKYILKQDAENTQETVFTDGEASLTWNILDPAPLDNYKPTFNDGKNNYTFTVLSPSNRLFAAKDDTAPVKSFDVLYFNPEKGKSFVKLLNSEAKNCHTLPQIEASAKTAVYEKEGIRWMHGNKNEAIFYINGEEYAYNNITNQ